MKKFIALTLALIMSFSCFSLVSFAEETETTEHLTEVPEGYVGVYTKDDLDGIKLKMAGNYILMNDITFEEYDYLEGGSFYNSGKGWAPIGTSTTPFNGIFDGNGYSINNLKINAPNDDYQGLFGYASNATIKNVKLTDVEIIAKDYAGAVCGYYFSSSPISSCVVTGSVNGKLYIGGICGTIKRASKTGESLIVTKCVNVADITAKQMAGGICGEFIAFDVKSSYSGKTTFYEASLSNCTNVGNINCSLYYSGGIVGHSNYYDNCIENSYNIGNLSGGTSGGIVGNNCTVKNSYSVGVARSGGIIGEDISNERVSFCYYLDGCVTELTATDGIAKSEDQLKKQTTFEGWDFETIWTIDGREDYPYPELRDVPLILPEDSKTEITGTVTVTGEAKVGSTLSAEIKDISPADSTFEYEWKADGEVVGTDASYTITQDDVGKEIILTIKGNGEFKGEFSSSAIVGECVHSLGEYVNNNDATCEKNETKSAVCEKCSEILTEEIEGTKLPHSFKNYIYDENATCTADGTETAKCENCDATDTIIAENTMVEHVFSDSWTIDKEATCVEEGVKSHHCKNCNATKDESVLNKLAHIYVAEVTEATCDKDGKVIYTCSCGDTYSKIIYATGHKDSDGNGRCDECTEYIEDNENSENENENKPDCKCICHETGIHSFLYRIFSYIQRYFKIDLLGKVFKLGQICKCGEYHY